MTTKTRDQLQAQIDQAHRDVAEAQAKAAAAKAAERELWEAEKAARKDGFVTYRDATYKTGGINKEQNALAEQFEAAVRAADGAAVLTTWIRWRYARAAAHGQSTALRSALEHTPVATPDVPNFAADLARTVAKVEAEHDKAGADKVTAYVEQYVVKALG